MPEVATEEEALHLLFSAHMNRAMGAHDLNEASTRSHCIYTLHLSSKSVYLPSLCLSLCDVTRTILHFSMSCTNHARFLTSLLLPLHTVRPSPEAAAAGAKVITAKLHLVDLAGSERIFRTKSRGVLQKEAGYINKSLSILEQVREGTVDSVVNNKSGSLLLLHCSRRPCRINNMCSRSWLRAHLFFYFCFPFQQTDRWWWLWPMNDVITFPFDLRNSHMCSRLVVSGPLFHQQAMILLLTLLLLPSTIITGFTGWELSDPTDCVCLAGGLSCRSNRLYFTILD